MAMLEFIRLAFKRKKSVENYFKFQRFQARILIKELEKYNLSKATRILDIGSGIGGYVCELAEKFPNTLIFILDLEPLEFAIQKTINLKNVKIIRGDATCMSFKENSFDFILASSVVEHIRAQRKLISEMHRTNRKGGVCYISFPPYYSPIGGHNLSPLHYLPGDLPLKLYSKFGGSKCSSFKNYGLIKTTVGGMKKMVAEHFKVLDIKPRIFSFLKPIIKIPVVRELVCHHIEFILRKID